MRKDNKMNKIRNVLLRLHISSDYCQKLIVGVARYASHHGPWVFYREYWNDQNINKTRLTYLRKRRFKIDGIIASDARDIEEVLAFANDIPVIVLWNLKDIRQDVPCIITNCVQIGKMGADYLIKRGFRHFGYCGFDELPWSIRRGQSFSNTISKAGRSIYIYKQRASKSPLTWPREITAMAQWLQSLPKPAAVMACNDDRGEQVIEACRFAGLSVPEEVAVLGVDNDRIICQLSYPSLSSVNLNTEKAGYEAAKCLDKLMVGQRMSARTIVVPATHIETRQSTDIMAIEDTVIANALSFIRRNINKPINANDVANEIAVSRQTLHGRFLKTFGCSIHDQIIYLRMEHVARMLVETNLSLYNIALSLGYPDSKHISRCFKKVMGMTSREYRMKQSGSPKTSEFFQASMQSGEGTLR